MATAFFCFLRLHKKIRATRKEPDGWHRVVLARQLPMLMRSWLHPNGGRPDKIFAKKRERYWFTVFMPGI
jgi:hypothetical protein